MSFISTFNSLSIRPWQPQGGQLGIVFRYVDNEQTQFIGYVETNYEGKYAIIGTDGVGGGNSLIAYKKEANNTLTELYQSDPAPRYPRGVGGYGNNTITGLLSSEDTDIGNTNTGSIEMLTLSASPVTSQVINGNVAQQQLGRTSCITGDGNIVYASSSNITANGYDIFSYTSSNGTWAKTNTLTTFSNTSTAIFLATNIDGSIIAFSDFTNQYVKFSRNNGNTWANLDTSNANIAVGDQFGTYLKFTSNGNILAVGARNADSTATNNGKIYVYEFNGNTYNLQNTLAPDPSIYSNGLAFGQNISISDNGNTITTVYFDSLNRTSAPYGINVYNKNNSGVYNLSQIISGNSNVLGTPYGNTIYNTSASNTADILYFGSIQSNVANSGNIYFYSSV